MVETFFSWPVFSEIVFPFVLVFTLLFAVLEKTKIMGENRQNHALVSLAIAMILIATPARTVVSKLAPFFAVVAVILLIFMLLWGFILQTGKEPLRIEGNLKTIFLIVLLASLAIAIIASTGYWDWVVNFLSSEKGFVINAITLVVIGVAAWLVVKYSGGK